MKIEKKKFEKVPLLLLMGGLLFSGCSQIEKLVKKPDEVKKDLTPPALPSVLFPSVSPYTHVGAAETIVIQGNASFDTAKIIGPNAAEIIPEGVAWSYTHTMVPDTEAELHFVAVDSEGNAAEPRIVVIRWYPTISLPLAAGNPGGFSTDVGSSFSAVMSAGPANKDVTDPATSYRANFGLHRIVREMRVTQ